MSAKNVVEMESQKENVIVQKKNSIALVNVEEMHVMTNVMYATGQEYFFQLVIVMELYLIVQVFVEVTKL